MKNEANAYMSERANLKNERGTGKCCIIIIKLRMVVWLNNNGNTDMSKLSAVGSYTHCSFRLLTP